VLALRRKLNGPENLSTLGAMNNLANSYHAAGRPDESLKLGEEVLPLCRKVLGPGTDTLLAMHNLASSYRRRTGRALKLGGAAALPKVRPGHHLTL
jgi:hypothetical protein